MKNHNIDLILCWFGYVLNSINLSFTRNWSSQDIHRVFKMDLDDYPF